MTICIPKKPIMFLCKGLGYSALFSWILIFGILIYYSNLEQNWSIMMFSIPSCIVQFVLTILWLNELNSKKHFIKWCDERPTLGSDSQ